MYLKLAFQSASGHCSDVGATLDQCVFLGREDKKTNILVNNVNGSAVFHGDLPELEKIIVTALANKAVCVDLRERCKEGGSVQPVKTGDDGRVKRPLLANRSLGGGM